jgi:hypothetical protein
MKRGKRKKDVKEKGGKKKGKGEIEVKKGKIKTKGAKHKANKGV